MSKTKAKDEKAKEVKLTKAGKPKKKPGRKKSKKNYYFDMDVQDAIIEYNQSTDDAFRSKIYQQKIHYAFDKLAENIINTFKFMYFDDPFEDVKNEVVAFLIINIHKWDHTKGSKAFSYFSIVAKNYLILHNNNNYKRYKSTAHISAVNNLPSGNHEYTENIKNLTEEVVEYFEENIPKIFKKKKDIDIAYAIIELFRRKEEVENFNKKSLYILIREMTNVNTSHITSVVNVFKKHYTIIVNNYYSPQSKKKHNINKFF